MVSPVARELAPARVRSARLPLGLLRSPAGASFLATRANAYSVFFLNPRKFIAHRQNCNTINAYASVCSPHTTHRMLLAIKQLKPATRRRGWREPINQAASTVTSIAGHCTHPR